MALAKNGNTHFYGQWQENSFTVNYHIDENSPASSLKTVVKYGTWTKTLTTTELGFSKKGLKFAGWKGYREIDNKWYVQDSNGKKQWITLTNGKLPAGYSFYIYKDGQQVMALAKSGNTHFYGTWK